MQPCVNLLGEVRHHGPGQLCEQVQSLSPRPDQPGLGRCPFGIGDRVGEFVQACHRNVEGEALQRLGHRQFLLAADGQGG